MMESDFKTFMIFNLQCNWEMIAKDDKDINFKQMIGKIVW